VRFLKFIHRWFGVVAALFVIMFALSGIVLNHRHFFSPVSIGRSYLPADYRFHNWNLAAVKGATETGADSLLIYGNIGVWLTDSLFSRFEPLNEGFRRGMDNRKTFQVLRSPSGNVYAGTLSGLYVLGDGAWRHLPLPVKELQVRGLTVKGDSLYVLTRSHLITGKDDPGDPGFYSRVLPHPEGYQARTSLFKALWVIHSGEILGLPGKILVDIMGVILIMLSLTGIVWFVAPDLMRALKKKVQARKRVARVNRFSIRWHNLLGIWAASILLIVTLTGMFLRPPLLIAIIRSDIGNIRGTVLDNPNPWHDKLRDMQYDRLSGQFIFSTSEGFYAGHPGLTDSLQRIPVQPPVSVMGINVFEQPADGVFIVGSFSGLFRWIPSAGPGHAHDMITGQPVRAGRGMAHPFGSLPVAGFIQNPSGGPYIFDYNAGVVSMSPGNNFPQMPEKIRNASPFPLWNVALEVHTGRFYSFMLGKYNILFIPVAGLVILSLVVSGVVLWLRDYRRKKRVQQSKTIAS
jgi:hypothetical protein